MWLPFSWRTCFVKPFMMEGLTESGILIAHHKNLDTIYARVTQVHPSCRNVRVGDWVLHLRNRAERVKSPDGAIYLLDERLVIGVVDPGDGTPWFQAEEEKEAVAAGFARSHA